MLEIRAKNERQANYNIFERCLVDIFHCQEEKPNLESLSLEFDYNQNHLPLSVIYRFVDGNFNLKSVSLYGLNDRDKTLHDLLDILNCDNSIEECELAGRWDRYHHLLEKIGDGMIPREEFPDLIRDLKKCITHDL